MYRLLVRSACLAGAVAVCTSCAQQWQLTGMERTRVLVDKRYDARPDANPGRKADLCLHRLRRSSD